LDEVKQHQVIAMIDALDHYREMVSKLNEREVFDIIDKLEVEFRVPLKINELQQFLTKIGENYFEKMVKELLGAGKDGKLIEGHTQTHFDRHIPVS